MKITIINILIFLLSIILFLILSPIGFIYTWLFKFKKTTGYLRAIAVSIDQCGNVVMQDLFNSVLINNKGDKFGHEDETISSVLGRNKQTQTLRYLGKKLDWVLNKIEEDHTIKSIGE